MFLADQSTGQAEVLNAATLQPVAAVSQVLAPGSQFDLFAKDGIVFFNDPTTQDAGIIRPDGTVVRAATYLSSGAPSPGRSGNGRLSLPAYGYAPGETGPGGPGGQFPFAGSVTSPLSSPRGLAGGALAGGALAGGAPVGGAPPGGTPAGGGPVGGLEITTRSLAPATVGERYTEKLTAAGGMAPYTWAASGLPSGLGSRRQPGRHQRTPFCAGDDAGGGDGLRRGRHHHPAILPLVVLPGSDHTASHLRRHSGRGPGDRRKHRDRHRITPRRRQRRAVRRPWPPPTSPSPPTPASPSPPPPARPGQWSTSP